MTRDGTPRDPKPSAPMPVIASILLTFAVVLAVVLGPQFHTHLWGPCLLALGLAALAAIPSQIRRPGRPITLSILIPGILVTAWFAWRAATSPVPELAVADGLLLAAAVTGFLVTRAAAAHPTAGRMFLWGLATLLLASVAIVLKQVADPEFVALFRSKPDTLPSGFFGHYSFGAHFLIGASLLLGGAAALGRFPPWTRVLWGSIALCAMVGVFLTKSRGAYVGACAGMLALTVVITLVGLRRKAKWAATASLVLPVLAVILVAGFIAGLSMAHEQRQQPGGVMGMMDNDMRLYFLGLAASCIALHPIAGGGAKSFSWECLRFWDPTNHGTGNHLPGHVHNEFVQAATDYGLLGAALLAILILTVIISSVLRCWLDDSPASADGDGWRLGGLAALTGILVHSLFEGVFRTAPGALLLGIALAACCHHTSPSKSYPAFHRWLPAIVLLASAVWLLPNGWRATTATAALWPAHYSKSGPDSDEAKFHALSLALDSWPTAELFLDRAAASQRISAAEPDEAASDDLIALAIADYRRAAELHPYNPTIAINLANLLSLVRDDPAAEAEFARTLDLQGGMESAFIGHWSLSSHLLRKGLRQFQDGQLNQAAATLEWAAREAEESNRLIPASGKLEQRITIHESLGAVHEAMEDFPAALEAYEFAASIPGGRRADFRVGALLASRGYAFWSQRRPGEALFLLKEGLRRILSTPLLPAGVSGPAKTALIIKLNADIQFLEGANIQPIQPRDD
jgi:O-antigen ligase